MNDNRQTRMADQRPAIVGCANCCNTFAVGPIGKVPRFCRPACRTMACAKAKRGGRPSAEDQQRQLIWGKLRDAGVIPADKPLPMRKAEDAA